MAGTLEINAVFKNRDDALLALAQLRAARVDAWLLRGCEATPTELAAAKRKVQTRAPPLATIRSGRMPYEQAALGDWDDKGTRDTLGRTPSAIEREAQRLAQEEREKTEAAEAEKAAADKAGRRDDRELQQVKSATAELASPKFGSFSPRVRPA